MNGYKNMKKIIGLDYDDVIGQLIPLLINKYNFIWNDNLDHSKIDDWDLTRFVKPECGSKIYSYLDNELYDHIKEVKDSKWGVEQLRKMEYRVIFITSNFVNTGNAKFEWLNRNDFNVEKRDFFECGDKSLIKFNLLLDDNYENVLSAGKRGIIFSQSWNLKNNHPRRVSSWKEFIKNMKENIYGL